MKLNTFTAFVYLKLNSPYLDKACYGKTASCPQGLAVPGIAGVMLRHANLTGGS